MKNQHFYFPWASFFRLNFDQNSDLFLELFPGHHFFDFWTALGQDVRFWDPLGAQLRSQMALKSAEGAKKSAKKHAALRRKTVLEPAGAPEAARGARRHHFSWFWMDFGCIFHRFLGIILESALWKTKKNLSDCFQNELFLSVLSSSELFSSELFSSELFSSELFPHPRIQELQKTFSNLNNEIA